MQNNLQVVKKILDQTKTIAVVGFSSRMDRAGYYVPAYLKQQGYRIFPVNPTIDKGLGTAAYPDLSALTEVPDLVLIFRRSEAVPPIVDQAIELSTKAVWMQLGIINEQAAQKAILSAGLDVVMDTCMMIEHRRYR